MKEKRLNCIFVTERSDSIHEVLLVLDFNSNLILKNKNISNFHLNSLGYLFSSIPVESSCQILEEEDNAAISLKFKK